MHEEVVISHSLIRTYILLLVILFLPITWSFADDDIASQLYYVLDVQDIAEGEKLLKRITPEDIEVMEDTTLLNYHYLTAYINSERELHQETISHLLSAKHICETSVGIHKIMYLQILDALGNEYEKLEDYDTAIAYYQEGIVKGFNISYDASNAYSSLLADVACTYEKRGWKDEIPGLWRSAWSYWEKDETPFSEYNYFPLYMLESFYYQYEDYDKGMSVVELISEFIKEKVGEDSSDYAEVLYLKGNLLCKLAQNEEAIQAYLKGISLIIRYNPNNIKTLEQLYGNLICAYAELGDIDKIEETLSEIMQFTRTYESSLYKDALYLVSNSLMKARAYDSALEYIKRLLTTDVNLTEEEWGIISQREQVLLHLQENSKILHNLLKTDSYHEGTSEWTSYKKDLSQAYFTDGQFKEATNSLMEIYDWYAKCDKLPDEELGEIVSWIVNCAQNDGDYETMLKVIPTRINYIKESLGMNNEQYYGALCSMIVAQIKLNMLAQAQETLDISSPLCIELYGKDSNEYVAYLHNQGRVYQLEGDLNMAKEFFNQSLLIAKQLSLPKEMMSRTLDYLGEVELKLRETL